MLVRTPSPCWWWCWRFCWCGVVFQKFLFAISTHSDIDIIDPMRTKFHGPHMHKRYVYVRACACVRVCVCSCVCLHTHTYMCILLSSFFKSKCAYLTMYTHILYKVSQMICICIHLYASIYSLCRYGGIPFNCYDDYYYYYCYSCMLMILMAIGLVWSEFVYRATFWWTKPTNDEWCSGMWDYFQWALTHACTCLTKNTNRQTTQPTTPIINSAVDTFRLIARKYMYLCSLCSFDVFIAKSQIQMRWHVHDMAKTRAHTHVPPSSYDVCSAAHEHLHFCAVLKFVWMIRSNQTKLISGQNRI